MSNQLFFKDSSIILLRVINLIQNTLFLVMKIRSLAQASALNTLREDTTCCLSFVGVWFLLLVRNTCSLSPWERLFVVTFSLSVNYSYKFIRNVTILIPYLSPVSSNVELFNLFLREIYEKFERNNNKSLQFPICTCICGLFKTAYCLVEEWRIIGCVS